MSQFQQTDWYDVPHYYDVIYDTGTQQEADFLEGVYERYVQSSGKQLLEPACGPGRLLAELGSRGYSVSGFDVNQAMLDYARRRIRKRKGRAVLKRMDLADFSFGAKKFDLAFCLVSSICHLLTEDEARRHLKLVAQALRTGGVYALGILMTEYADRRPTTERWVAERDGVKVDCSVKTWPANRKTRTSAMRTRLTVHGNDETRQYESQWKMRTYGPRQLSALIKSEPRLELVGCHTFDYDLSKQDPIGGDRLDKVVLLRRVG